MYHCYNRMKRFAEGDSQKVKGSAFSLSMWSHGCRTLECTWCKQNQMVDASYPNLFPLLGYVC